MSAPQSNDPGPSLPSFAELYGRAPTFTARAPGRVNLIGEHTDYTGGFVLPTAIPRTTVVELAPRAGDEVRVVSANEGAGEPFAYRLGAEAAAHAWYDYVCGVTWVLRAEGHALTGFDARITSDVPLGAGLSSSASLLVALLRALRQAFDLPLDDVRIAVLARKAENDFVGAPVGIMDQMAASLADVGIALLLDTRSLEFRRVALPGSVELLVFNSGVRHNHAGGEYRTRRAECEEATRLLGVPMLRDVDEARLPEIERLPEPVRRRARHVVTENARVQRFVAAAAAGDVEALGRLLYEGHASLRDDFQVSVPEIDLIVKLARAQPGVVGARLTGGGFGGSVVILTRRGTAGVVGERLQARYRAETGREPSVLAVR